MNLDMKWLAGLLQRAPLVGILIVIIVAGYLAIPTLYKDRRSDNIECEVKVANITVRLDAAYKKIEEQQGKIDQFYIRDAYKDSISKAKLDLLNDRLNQELANQREINKLQKENIFNRSKAIKSYDATKKRNEETIKSLKNDLKK